MSDPSEILSRFNEWLENVKAATARGDGAGECEGTRMVLGIGSIMHAYHPGTWTKGMANDTIAAFKGALRHLHTLNEPPEADKDAALWHKNTGDRLANLLDVMPKWCPSWSPDESD